MCMWIGECNYNWFVSYLIIYFIWFPSLASLVELYSFVQYKYEYMYMSYIPFNMLICSALIYTKNVSKKS